MFDFLNYILTLFVLFAPITFLLIIIYRMRTFLYDSKIYVLTFFILPAILLHKLLFFDQTLSAQDFNNIQIPFFESLRYSLQEHFLVPIWDTTFGGGFDSFSNPLAFYFSIFSFIFYFTKDVYFGANLYLYFQIVFLAFSSFVFLRELGFKKISSFGASFFLTFNAFVIMRLSPGIGIEYLYTYKWVPLLLLFSYSYFYKKVKGDLIFLSISLAFLFEGNPNIAFAVILLWCLFLSVYINLKKINSYLDILKVGILSFSIFSVKLLPGIYLMSSSGGRISEIVSGWRVSKVSIDRLLSYYLPLKDNFLPGPFTPGILGFTVFILGIFSILYFIIKDKKLDKLTVFSFLSLIFGILFSSDNIFSNFIFSLSVFNRITINPSFYVFLIVPIGLFAANFYETILNKFPNYLKFIKLGILIITFLSFYEVLKGPSTLGNSTYSFNFYKMNVSELQTYNLYNSLKTKNDGNFVFIDGNKFFNLPNATKILNLKETNKHTYFYGSAFQKDISRAEAISFIKPYSKYLITTSELKDDDLEFIENVNMKNYLKDYQNYAILINKDNISSFTKSTNWDGNLFIYRVKETFSPKAIDLKSNHPYSYSVLLNENSFINNSVLTSISYSKNWIIKKQNGERVEFDKDSNGLLVLKNLNPYETIYFVYVNYYIYLGLLISFLSYIYILINFYKYSLK